MKTRTQQSLLLPRKRKPQKQLSQKMTISMREMRLRLVRKILNERSRSASKTNALRYEAMIMGLERKGTETEPGRTDLLKYL